MKYRSILFKEAALARIRRNAEGTPLMASMLDGVKTWDEMSDDQLWESMFGSELQRSPMILSYGWCPACKQTVQSGAWQFDLVTKPWKVTCPHCKGVFPKNDFGAYYRSGLDGHHVFRRALADSSLLFNTEAPGASDPKRSFGVDDGTGYREGKDRWMFIGTWLVRTWERRIFAGIVLLARAYVLTGEKRYARKCGVLLDRVADLFPEFDFFEQGVMYEEERTSRGYVSYWCDTTVQLREMALAYDAVFDALKEDKELLSFVTEKSIKYDTPYRKTTFVDIQRNIEHRIFADAATHGWKIASNYPWPDVFLCTLKLVLTNWPVKPEDMSVSVSVHMKWGAEDDLHRIMQNVTKADGLSGEKGLAGYSPIALNETMRLISLFSLHDPETLPKLLRRYPKFLGAFRLYANAWFLLSYFPGSGDMGSLNTLNTGVPFQPGYSAFDNEPSMSAMLYSFEGMIWKLYEVTKDPNLLRLVYDSKSFELEKCFGADFSLSDKPRNLRTKVKAIMEEKGTELEQESANYQTWKLALLHSGSGMDRRGSFLDYDSGGVHGHNDGMNIGLYAKGMNFLPDLGYPPVHRPGGWYSKFFYWYRSAASHNTVIVDGKEHRDFCYFQRDVNEGQGTLCESGRTVLWGVGRRVKAIAADDPQMAGVERFERMLVQVDVSDKDSYWFDLFRVRGGSEHVKLTRGSMCALELHGATLVPFTPEIDPYGMGFIRDKNAAENFQYAVDPDLRFVRNMRIDRKPKAGWYADWKYLHKYKKYFGDFGDRELVLRLRDVTEGAEVMSFDAFYDSYNAILTCEPEAWKGKTGHPEELLPGVAVIHRGAAPLTTAFIGAYEAREGGGVIDTMQRLVPTTKSGKPRGGDVAVELRLTGGARDLIVAADAQDGTVLIVPQWEVETDAALCHIRRKGESLSVTAMKGSYVRCGKRRVDIDASKDGAFEADLSP